jgi:hypothetical protein
VGSNAPSKPPVNTVTTRLSEVAFWIAGSKFKVKRIRDVMVSAYVMHRPSDVSNHYARYIRYSKEERVEKTYYPGQWCPVSERGG